MIRQDVEHPDITHAHNTGYSRQQWRDILAQQAEQPPEHNAKDAYGVTVDLERDKYAVSPQGVIIAECNLSRYLAEQGYEINFE